MQQWAYTFPPVSKAAWIDQIERDLKGKSIETLYKEWWPGETLIPVFNIEDEPADPIILPEQLFSSPPEILEEIDLKKIESADLNAYLLEALRFGTQSFLVHPSGYTLEREKHFKDVFPEMVNWHVYHDEDAKENIQTLKNLSPATFHLRTQALETGFDLQKFSTDAVSTLFEYQIPAGEAWTEKMGEVFTRIIQHARLWENQTGNKSSYFNQCVLKLHADPHYFKQLVQTRVVHLLWLNLMRYHDIPITNHRYLECHISPTANENPDRYLIRASMSALAAFLTGTPVLAIHHIAEGNTAPYYKRIDRNLHHLLHLESGLPTGEDPLAGAYAIDHYTRLWTERIWNSVIEK